MNTSPINESPISPNKYILNELKKNTDIVSTSLNSKAGWDESILNKTLEANKKIKNVLSQSLINLDENAIDSTNEILSKEYKQVKEKLTKVNEALNEGVGTWGIKRLNKEEYDRYLNVYKPKLEALKTDIKESIQTIKNADRIISSALKEGQIIRELHEKETLLQEKERELEELKNKPVVRDRIQEFANKPIMGAGQSGVPEETPQAGPAEGFIPPPIGGGPPPPPPPMGGPIVMVKPKVKKFEDEPERLDVKYKNLAKNNISLEEAINTLTTYIESVEKTLNPIRELVKNYTELTEKTIPEMSSVIKSYQIEKKSAEDLITKIDSNPGTVVLTLNSKGGVKPVPYFNKEDIPKYNEQIRMANEKLPKNQKLALIDEKKYSKDWVKQKASEDLLEAEITIGIFTQKLNQAQEKLDTIMTENKQGRGEFKLEKHDDFVNMKKELEKKEQDLDGWKGNLKNYILRKEQSNNQTPISAEKTEATQESNAIENTVTKESIVALDPMLSFFFDLDKTTSEQIALGDDFVKRLG